MPFVPAVVRPLSPGAGLPPRLPFGPSSRYAGPADAELLAAHRLLQSALDLWSQQARRFRAAGVTESLGGPCAAALLAAHAQLVAETTALDTALAVRADEIRRAVAATLVTSAR